MHNLLLFTDGSVDSKTHIGFGAYFAISHTELPFSIETEHVTLKQFENTSSTKLELQTLVWALHETAFLHSNKKMQITVYTDSQNIVSLPARREKLESQNYYANNGKRLNNSELYQDFFKLIDQFNCQFIKVSGHKPKHTKNDIDRIFEWVDKASRAALRLHIL